MTQEKLFALYRERFVPIYSDFVSLKAIKPKQILIEQENVLAHLSQSCNQNISKQFQEENLVKAYNHMIRVTLDLHKLVWAASKEKLDFFVLNEKKRLAFNLPDSNVLRLYEQFMSSGRSARSFEMSHVGSNPLESIDRYEEVNKIGNELLGKLDEIKLKTITHWLKFFTTKEYISGFLTSFIAAVIFHFISLYINF
jgi:hypothetical protein